MTRSDSYRVLVDGKPSPFAWETLDRATQAAAHASDEHPEAEIRIRRPDIVVRQRSKWGLRE